jgi:protein CpxP
MTNPIRSFILCSVFAASVALAAPQAPSEQPEAHNLRQRLALTRDQQSQFRAINQDRKAQLSSVQGDTSLSPSARKQKVKAIRADAETKIRAMLTETQLAEYDQIKRERHEEALRNRQTAVPPAAPPQ